MEETVKITANKNTNESGATTYEVLIDGLEGRLKNRREFAEPLKAMRYMFYLSKRLELTIDNIQLTALSIDYRRAKAQLNRVVEYAKTEIDALDIEDMAPVALEDKRSATNDADEKVEEPSKWKQYKDLKEKHQDALLLFRCGDFYEAYEEDAVDAANILGITITKRNMKKNPIRMAGFPHHALDQYLPKLIRAGKRIAICDEIEEKPKKRTKKQITDLFTMAEEVAQ